MSNEHHNEQIIDDEQTLNPPPSTYKVSFFTKCVFLVLFGLGISAYAYMIIERRLSQNRFLMNNQMAAVKLTPTALPSVNVYDLSAGADINLSSEVASWTLLNLWATWCPPCKEEMPSLELLQQKLKGKLKIIALSVDDNIDSVKEFVAINKPSFKVFWDKSQISPAIFGVEKYPETFLISPDGLLTTQFSGPRDWGSSRALDYFLNIIQ